MAWSYFLIIIALVIVLFIFVKRPMYEVMFVAFISLCLITGNASNVGEYWVSASRSYLPFTLTGFVIFAVIFEKNRYYPGYYRYNRCACRTLSRRCGLCRASCYRRYGVILRNRTGNSRRNRNSNHPHNEAHRLFFGACCRRFGSRVDSGTCYSAYSGNSGHVRNAQCRNARKIQRLAILDVCVAHMPVAYSSAFYNSFLCDP